MATIGLRDLYRALITTDENGKETYGKPVRMAKAISAELSVEVSEAIYQSTGAEQHGNANSVKEYWKEEGKAPVCGPSLFCYECNQRRTVPDHA